MKTLIVLLTLTFFHHSFAQEDDSSTITIIVENLKSNHGTVIAALYEEKSFLQSTPLKTASSKIENGKATVTFKAVEAGTYGITAFHDANENGRMDIDTSGIPLEVYGISNNKFNPYGPPVWNDAKFNFDGKFREFNINLTR